MAYLEKPPQELEQQTALIVFLSRLNLGPQHHEYIQIVTECLESLAHKFEGRLFFFRQSDFICICKNVTSEELEAVVRRIRRLFSEDAGPSASLSEGAFYEIFSLNKSVFNHAF